MNTVNYLMIMFAVVIVLLAATVALTDSLLVLAIVGFIAVLAGAALAHRLTIRNNEEAL